MKLEYAEMDEKRKMRRRRRVRGRENGTENLDVDLCVFGSFFFFFNNLILHPESD